MNKKTLALFLLSSFFFFACSPKEDSAAESAVLRSYRLIDEQRTDEAITLLEAELKTDSQNYELKSALASAYAHKAGFKIQKLIPLVSLAEKFSPKQLKSKTTSEAAKSETDTESKTESKKLSANLTKISAGFEIFDTIPTVSDQDVVYLDYAIYILNSFENQIKPEDIVYRTLLMVLKIKYNLNLEKEISVFDQQACTVDFKSLNEKLQRFGKDLAVITADVAQLNPDKSDQINQFSQSMKEALVHVNNAADKPVVRGEHANMALKQALMQTQFAGLAQCL